jgi:nucleotide-binding universal stress UspA family protein
MAGGPVVIAYDGSESAERALREAGALLPGRSRVGQVLLGSTSRDLIRHAACPVVVVRG